MSEEVDNAGFAESISPCFEPYLNLYIEAEDKYVVAILKDLPKPLLGREGTVRIGTDVACRVFIVTNLSRDL